MSCSSIWVMNKDFEGECLEEFVNSWRFTPVACNAIYHRYLPHEVDYKGDKKDYISSTMFDKELFGRLNNCVNNAECQYDRVVWEMTNQQIFFTKDKEFIADSIIRFSEDEQHQEDIGQCKERFKEIADFIRNLNETKYLYFIFKNTSCDDGVEWWFEGKYNEEIEEFEKRSLREVDKFAAEFVIIEDSKITGFTSNLKFFNKESTN